MASFDHLPWDIVRVICEKLLDPRAILATNRNLYANRQTVDSMRVWVGPLIDRARALTPAYFAPDDYAEEILSKITPETLPQFDVSKVTHWAFMNMYYWSHGIVLSTLDRGVIDVTRVRIRRKQLVRLDVGRTRLKTWPGGAYPTISARIVFASGNIPAALMCRASFSSYVSCIRADTALARLLVYSLSEERIIRYGHPQVIEHYAQSNAAANNGWVFSQNSLLRVITRGDPDVFRVFLKYCPLPLDVASGCALAIGDHELISSLAADRISREKMEAYVAAMKLAIRGLLGASRAVSAVSRGINRVGRWFGSF